jgi:pimeloyl-ACP methyl ester carboxylesterase
MEPEVRAECGFITVLEDRSDPDGRTIDLNVMILPAEKPQGAAPLFLLAGGPGLGATQLVGLALGPYAAVREIRDIVLVDQRGTGKSNPLRCADNVSQDPQALFGHLFDPQRLAACRDEIVQRADPTLYGTLHVVADLEEVRQALGVDKVVLWGGSGGTRTALMWLREAPEHIEAVAIDGVSPPAMRAPSGYARGSQDALDKVFEDCAAQEDCRAAFPQLQRDFDHLLQRFDEGPVRTHVTREDGTQVEVTMQRGDFGYAVRGMLYRSDAIRKLPQWIHEAAIRDDVHVFAQHYWERQVALLPLVSMGVHLSVFGTEDIPFIEPDEFDALTRGTFLGTYILQQYLAADAAWQGRGTLPADFHDPVRSDVPVLLLSGWYDPSTPPSLAEEVARTLSNSRHIVVRNEAHGAGFGCARQAVITFLRQASLEDLGEVCEDVGPIRFDVP